MIIEDNIFATWNSDKEIPQNGSTILLYDPLFHRLCCVRYEGQLLFDEQRWIYSEL